MTTSVEIINPELWSHLLGEYERDPDPRTQRINHAMLGTLESGFRAFADFREGLEPQGFRAVRKYLSGIDPDHPSQDVVILVAENLLHPSTDYAARNERDRYDMLGDMVAGERTFHPKVAAQLRMQLWRRDQSHQGGPAWHGHVRIRYWDQLNPHLQPSGLIPSLFVTTEKDSRGLTFTNLSFPVNREDPSQTAAHIELALKIGRPLILAGFQGHRFHFELG